MQATIAQDPYGMAKVGVEEALEKLDGKQVKEKVDTGAKLITPDNAESTSRRCAASSAGPAAGWRASWRGPAAHAPQRVRFDAPGSTHRVTMRGLRLRRTVRIFTWVTKAGFEITDLDPRAGPVAPLEPVQRDARAGVALRQPPQRRPQRPMQRTTTLEPRGTRRSTSSVKRVAGARGRGKIAKPSADRHLAARDGRLRGRRERGGGVTSPGGGGSQPAALSIASNAAMSTPSPQSSRSAVRVARLDRVGARPAGAPCPGRRRR